MIPKFTNVDINTWLNDPMTLWLMEELRSRRRDANTIDPLVKLPADQLERELGRRSGLLEAYDYVILLPERMKSIRQNREANDGRTGK